MPDSQPVQTHESMSFVCDCEESHREACAGEGFYAQFGNNRYCILHYPAVKDNVLFNQAVERKLFGEARDYKFQGVWFSEELNARGQEFISTANFSGARFNGKAIFQNATFSEPANFENATFYAESIFSGVTFKTEATFESTRFHGEADFTSAIFNAEARFLSAIFSGEANFKEATFNAIASFVYSTFERRAEFMAAKFNGEAYFGLITFEDAAIFDSVTFGGWAGFDHTKFKSFVVFERAMFESVTDFGETRFIGDAHFNYVRFKQNSSFRAVVFEAEARFTSATFEFAIFDNTFFQRDADFQWASINCAGFGGVRFNGIAGFQSARFSQDAIFEGTDFQGYADFMQANFDEASFNLASFRAEARFTKMKSKGLAAFESAKFKAGADFIEANFDAEANFRSAVFNGNAHFSSAIFSGKTYFSNADFQMAANFISAAIKDNFIFVGEKLFADGSKLDFSLAIVEKPERVSFHHCRLRPEWFMLTDPRKFEFDNVEWVGLKEELKRLKVKGEWNHKQHHIVYRQLATNAEENHRYAEASQFRFASLEARRLEKFGGFVPWRLDWWYWLASCYGESVSRAFLVFTAVIALSAFVFTRMDFDSSAKLPVASISSFTPATTLLQNPGTPPHPLSYKDAVIYSLNVAILQKPEPKPYSFSAKFLVWLETVLGPAQAALLALAVRRRFMR